MPRETISAKQLGELLAGKVVRLREKSPRIDVALEDIGFGLIVMMVAEAAGDDFADAVEAAGAALSGTAEAPVVPGGAFMDATCEKCGRRIGWFGNMVDRPPCERCGHLPEREALEDADAQLEAIRAEMRAGECPKCGRPKATTLGQVLAGGCPTYFARRDPDAENDCRSHTR